MASSETHHPPNSEDSEDEYERPNRWTGPASTWRQLNGAEIDTLTALNEIRHRDLPVHLYNSFMLSHRNAKKQSSRDVVKPVPNQDINIITGQPVKEDNWKPPRSWVAWPLPAESVPHPQFMGRADDPDELFTSRPQQAQRAPRAELEDSISSSILRIAKEKFQARQIALRNANTVVLSSNNSDAEDNEPNTGTPSSSIKSRGRRPSMSQSVKYESSSDFEMLDVDDVNDEEREEYVAPGKIMPLKSVVSADDELSHNILRPSVEGILSKLDRTLTVLHNVQISRRTCPSESESSDASSRSPSRSRSRSRSQEPSRNNSQLADNTGRRPPGSQPTEGPNPGKKRLGRPKKVYPRFPGETDREFAIRIARLRKEPIPHFAEDDAEPVSDATPPPDLDAERTNRNAKAKDRAERAHPKSRRRHEDSETDASSSEEEMGVTAETRRKRPGKARLRDWRDILGAAALAGFPPSAIDRAARRCADLFGQKFTLHTMEEEADNKTTLKRMKHYHAGMNTPGFLEDAHDGDDEMPSQEPSSQTPNASQRSREAPRSQEPLGNMGSQHRPLSRRARSRPEYFCNVSDCPRFVEPFTRRWHLLRHLRLKHNYQGHDLPINDIERPIDRHELPIMDDGADEMHGAVHVDGFLKPIRLRRSWRPDLIAKQRRRAQKRNQALNRARQIQKRISVKTESQEMQRNDEANSD